MKDEVVEKKGVVVPSGAYAARVLRIADTGTQLDEFTQKKTGKTRYNKTMRVSYECTNDTYEYENEEGEIEERNYVVHKKYNRVWGQNSGWRQAIEILLGRPVQQGETIDYKTLLNKPCIVNVVDYTKQDGTPGTKVGALTAVTKGLKVNALENETQFFSLDADEYDHELFNSFPDWLKTEIAASPEYKALLGGDEEEQQEKPKAKKGAKSPAKKAAPAKPTAKVPVKPIPAAKKTTPAAPVKKGGIPTPPAKKTK